MPILLVLLVGHLRQPGRRQPAARDRRPRDPRRVHPAAGASPWSPTCRSSRSTSSRMLGLGLAIDYALFMVSRFREELAAAGSVRGRAGAARWRRPGRTVAFSGLTVAISLAACCSSRRCSCARWGSAAWRPCWSRWSPRSRCCRRCSPCSASGSTRCGCPLPRRAGARSPPAAGRRTAPGTGSRAA